MKIDSITMFIINVIFYFFTVVAFAGNLEESLFEEFADYNQKAERELDFFASNFFDETSAYFELWTRFKSGKTEHVEINELLRIGTPKYMEEYAAQSAKINHWKKHFGYGLTNRMQQQHVKKLLLFMYNFRTNLLFKIWQHYKSPEFDEMIRLFNDISSQEKITALVPNLITKLYLDIKPYGDLAPLVKQSYFLRKINEYCPEVIPQLKKWKPAKNWAAVSFNFTKTGPEITLEQHLVNILNSVDEGIIHYAHLEQNELDEFHNRVNETFIGKNSSQENIIATIPTISYSHKGMKLSLRAFRLLFGNIYFGIQDKNSPIDFKMVQEEIFQHLPLTTSLQAFLQFTDEYECKEIKLEHVDCLRQNLLIIWHQKFPNDFHGIHARFAGRNFKEDRKIVDYLKLPTSNSTLQSPQKNFSQAVHKNPSVNTAPGLVAVIQDKEDAKTVILNYYERYKEFCKNFMHEFLGICGKDWDRASDKFSNLFATNARSLEPLRQLTHAINGIFNKDLPKDVYRGFFLHNNPDGFFSAWEKYLSAKDRREELQAIAYANKILALKSSFEIQNIILNFATMFKAITFHDSWEKDLFQLSFFKISLSPAIPLNETCAQKELRVSLTGKNLNEEIILAIKNQQTAPVELPMSENIICTLQTAQEVEEVLAPTKEVASHNDEVLSEVPQLSFDSKKIISMFHEGLRAKFKQKMTKTSEIVNSVLSIESLNAQLRQMISHLGLEDHPYLNESQSYSPNFKIYMKSWRDSSKESFLENISHFSKAHKKSFLALFDEIEDLYTHLLSNAKDYGIFYQFIENLDYLSAKDGELSATLDPLKKANKEFFYKMLDDSFAKTSYFYPLNKNNLNKKVTKVSNKETEKIYFLENHLLSAKDLQPYLEHVKEMLYELNNTYLESQQSLHEVENLILKRLDQQNYKKRITFLRRQGYKPKDHF